MYSNQSVIPVLFLLSITAVVSVSVSFIYIVHTTILHAHVSTFSIYEGHRQRCAPMNSPGRHT